MLPCIDALLNIWYFCVCVCGNKKFKMVTLGGQRFSIHCVGPYCKVKKYFFLRNHKLDLTQTTKNLFMNNPQMVPYNLLCVDQK